MLLSSSLEPVDVALDPGHSRADVGAAGGGLREYQLTLALAERVRARLEDAHLSVRLTRMDDLPLTAYTNPLATEHLYELDIDRVINAILLGILTYDDNLLVIRPGHTKRRRGRADRHHRQ